ncbi:hypothetical protein GCM10009795_040170 [Nocardioides hankookensis]|uniref:Uncharacterized protein n=1 Tax=Nocardioides hankookensis TaxID=443157 RepID=A0ABW1LRB3_9ACTN
MSNRRRIKTPTAGPGQSYASQIAIVKDRTKNDGGTIEGARKASHDTLIVKLGALRRSGVWWTEYYAGEAQNVITQLHEDIPSTPQIEASVAQMRELMSNPRAVLVVAWAIAATPGGQAL